MLLSIFHVLIMACRGLLKTSSARSWSANGWPASLLLPRTFRLNSDSKKVVSNIHILYQKNLVGTKALLSTHILRNLYCFSWRTLCIGHWPKNSQIAIHPQHDILSDSDDLIMDILSITCHLCTADERYCAHSISHIKQEHASNP